MLKGTNLFLLENLGLPVVTDLASLSEQIGLSQSLLFVLSTDSATYYKKWSIPKKDGSRRTIYEPSYSLKLVQRWVLEKILYRVPVSPYSYGFQKGASNPLKANALAHKDQLFLFKLDFKEFFPSIRRDRVFYLFHEVGYNGTMVNLFANLCTLHGTLPQGAVTSPYLSSLVCRQLDKRISKYCSKRGIVYTRYADDLTFSSNDKGLLKSIYSMIKRISQDEGFRLNAEKTRLLTPKGKKTVTGITVNQARLNAPKEMKRKVRALLHNAIQSGDYSRLPQIRGYLAYISSIEEDYLPRIKAYVRSLAQKKDWYDPQAVLAYNENKLFDDLEDLLWQARPSLWLPDDGFDVRNYSLEELDDEEKPG